jgi:ribosomal protein S27E
MKGDAGARADPFGVSHTAKSSQLTTSYGDGKLLLSVGEPSALISIDPSTLPSRTGYPNSLDDPNPTPLLSSVNTAHPIVQPVHADHTSAFLSITCGECGATLIECKNYWTMDVRHHGIGAEFKLVLTAAVGKVASNLAFIGRRRPYREQPLLPGYAQTQLTCAACGLTSSIWRFDQVGSRACLVALYALSMTLPICACRLDYLLI